LQASRLGPLATVPEDDAAEALATVLTAVRSPGAPPLLIIVDEYDNFTNQLLTSGFNIAQVITLEDHTLNMMGFTQSEVEAYVAAIFTERAWPEELHRRVLEDLRIDVNWLRRLTGGSEPARELVEQLLFDGSLPVDMTMLSSTFNKERFFQPAFFPLSLYCLGRVTFLDRFRLGFPNLSVRTLCTGYFNELEDISVLDGYTGMFQRFLDDRDWAALFDGYWQRYIGQIPETKKQRAFSPHRQAFDKANENFFRTTFYELCTRYLGRQWRAAVGAGGWQGLTSPRLRQHAGPERRGPGRETTQGLPALVNA
jgi:hypothetical protein